MSRRWIATIAIAVVGAVVAAAVIVRLDEVSTFDFRTEPFGFASGDDTLSGTLALPDGNGPFGLVVFIHGDGPADDSHDTGYLPIWEALAQAGYASLSWSKPGVGDSTGNWELQSMSERADEVLAAIRAVEGHPELDPGRVGLLAFSQGGWPLPMVAEQTEIEFAIAIGTAINWRTQGAYDLRTALAHDDATDAERASALQFNDAIRSLSSRGASYDEYLAFVQEAIPPELERFDLGPMSADRWEFVRINTFADATRDLPSLDDTPVLLMLGGRDVHVDVDDTERAYRGVLGPDCLTVERFPDATHALSRPELERSEALTVIQAIWEPRGLFAEGALDRVRDFAEFHECAP